MCVCVWWACTYNRASKHTQNVYSLTDIFVRRHLNNFVHDLEIPPVSCLYKPKPARSSRCDAPGEIIALVRHGSSRSWDRAERLRFLRLNREAGLQPSQGKFTQERWSRSLARRKHTHTHPCAVRDSAKSVLLSDH